MKEEQLSLDGGRLADTTANTDATQGMKIRQSASVEQPICSSSIIENATSSVSSYSVLMIHF